MSAEMITYQPKSLIIEDWSHLQTSHFKPRGVWYSPVEGGKPSWRRWCEGEGFRRRYTHQYRLEVPYCSLSEALDGEGQGKVLLLETKGAVLEFAEEFQDDGGNSINWVVVAGLVSGIEINPYQRALRWSGWYSWWDIPSGCIWKQPGALSLQEVPLDWDGSVEPPSWGSFTSDD